MSEWKSRPGERSGWHWRLTAGEGGRGKLFQFDPDAWKTFLHERLTTALGGRGALTLFGQGRAGSAQHEMIAAHCAAESSESKPLRGVVFDKWSQLPHRPDNHLFDCLAGACAAASLEGMVWSAASAAGQPEEVVTKPKPLSLAELQREKRRARA